MIAHDRFVGATPAQQAAMDLRVQRLDAAAHDLGKAGVLGDFLDGDAVAVEQLGGAAGREDFDAAGAQFARKFYDA